MQFLSATTAASCIIRALKAHELPLIKVKLFQEEYSKLQKIIIKIKTFDLVMPLFKKFDLISS